MWVTRVVTAVLHQLYWFPGRVVDNLLRAQRFYGKGVNKAVFIFPVISDLPDNFPKIWLCFQVISDNSQICIFRDLSQLMKQFVRMLSLLIFQLISMGCRFVYGFRWARLQTGGWETVPLSFNPPSLQLFQHPPAFLLLQNVQDLSAQSRYTGHSIFSQWSAPLLVSIV